MVVIQTLRAKITKDNWEPKNGIFCPPPYQGKDHGTTFYCHIYDTWKNDNSVIELTVEHPKECFDSLGVIENFL